jgi:hypothetical protein
MTILYNSLMGQEREKIEDERLNYTGLIFREIDRLGFLLNTNNQQNFAIGVRYLLSLVLPLSDEEFRLKLDEIVDKYQGLVRSVEFERTIGFERGELTAEEWVQLNYDKAVEIFDCVVLLLERKGILRQRLGVAEFR